jgi:energy-coupling factor transporter ATP-binding protein EcfA2
MNRIDTLHIHNFKFFQAQEPIKLGGKHMLLYGENGSGKSSVYWSLYTLFEASLKESDDQIQKYFSKTLFDGEDCLVNIHAPQTAPGSDDFNSFIRLVTDDEQPVTYSIPVPNLSIRGNADAQRINYASDFINYRLLLGFSSFSHSEPIDLYNLFRWNIFTYVRFPAVDFTRNGDTKSVTSASEMWADILKGPNEYDFGRKYSDEEFAEYVDSPAYTAFKQSFQLFHERFQALIDYINLHAPDYLKKLGYSNFDFQLDLQPATFSLESDPDKYHLNPFAVGLTVTEYDGIPQAVKKPHSFLNEAKFSAMAISIRFAILKQKLQENCLKFIVLDDLLISLDMSNRQRVLDLILKEFTTNYQIISLTHDRSFYEITKEKIKNAGFEKQWVFYEMYIDDTDNSSTPKPIIIPAKSKLKKAEEFIALHDYPAAGIYLRKECEDLIEQLLPDFLKYEVKTNNEGNLQTVALTLNDRIGKLQEFCLKEGIAYEPIKDLKIYKDCFLNVVAHNDKESPLYKSELINVLQALKELKKVKRTRHVIKSNKDLLFDLNNGAANTFHSSVRVKGNLLLTEEEGKPPRISFFNQCEVRKTVLNGTENNEPFSENSLVDFYRRKCADMGLQPIHDLFQLFRYQGNPIQQKLDELLNA